jgi:hypothetical protein
MKMLKKIIMTLGLCIAIPAFAVDVGGWGAGVVVGEPTAITIKKGMDNSHAFDAGLGYSWNHSVLLYADYLLQFPGSLSSASSGFVSQLIPYIGIGPEVEFYSNDHKKKLGDELRQTVLSARVPLGIAWDIPDTRVQTFIEVVPLLNVVPGVEMDLHGGIGARYFF